MRQLNWGKGMVSGVFGLMPWAMIDRLTANITQGTAHMISFWPKKIGWSQIWQVLRIILLPLLLLMPNIVQAAFWYGDFRYEEEYNDERSFVNLFGNKIAGSLGSSSDVDWYGFSLPAKTNVKVTFEGNNYQPGIWNLSWFSPTMQGLSELNVTTSISDGNPNYTYTLSTGDFAGTYYLRVKPYSTTFKPDVYLITVASIASYPLSVTKTGTGSGTVGPANLNCGSTICSASYASGTNVTLTATAASGSTFNGWSGSGCSGTGTCTVSLTQARSVTATFTAINILTITKAGTGSGTVGPSNLNCGSSICSAAYASGTNVTLMAIAASNSTFGGWSGSGCSGTGTCIVSMTQARTVTANFTATTASSYTLTVTKAGNGSGSVSPSAVDCGNTICNTSYASGSNVTLTATAASGSTFAGWSGSGCSGTGTCVVSMTQARSVTANFTVPPVSAALYDGIYQWDTGAYLSLHRLGADALIATIYWENASDTLAVDKLAITKTDTFDLLAGPIVGSTATIGGTGFFRACSLSYSLEFNGDSTLKVTRLSVGNNPGVSSTDVDCAARYNAVGTVWTIPRIF